jgi:inosine-uridine nucleoside N-ribohydrolase
MRYIPVIIDTDPGHDDAMALILAIQSTVLEVRAVTTVCGNSTIENTTRNARYILSLLGREDIPVYSGAATPLTRPLVQAVVHGESGLAGIDPDNPPGCTGDAAERLIALAKSDKQLTLITLGPLTNIATAIRLDPEVMLRLKRILIMGGAISVPGNKNRVAEFNIFVDPEAADAVFRFPVPKTIVPLDACNRIRFSLSDFQAITNPQLRDALLRMARPYIRNVGKDEGITAALMYDPLTVFAALQPGCCRTYRMNIAIETEGILTRGMTVADRRRKPEAEPNVTVIRSISEDRFRKTFMEVLNRKR